jgi:hypothetical protein
MRLRRAGAGEAECTDGIEILPRSLTPIAMYLLPVAAVAMAASALAFVIFRADTPSSLSDS